MKTKILPILIGLLAFSAFAMETKYSCTVKKWNYSRGDGIDCGTVSAKMGQNSDMDSKECKTKVFIGSAWGSKCYGLHIVLGTFPGPLSNKNFKDMTSLLICPESAPENFQLSLLPHSSNSEISMDCSRQD